MNSLGIAFTKIMAPHDNTSRVCLMFVCLSFAIAVGPRQRSHSQVRVPRNSWPHFTFSDPRLHQTAGPDPRICIPQEQGGPVIPPGSGFPFRRLLRLAGATVEVFDPASTRDLSYIDIGVFIYHVGIGSLCGVLVWWICMFESIWKLNHFSL
jgi:hypothetical protein